MPGGPVRLIVVPPPFSVNDPLPVRPVTLPVEEGVVLVLIVILELLGAVELTVNSLPLLATEVPPEPVNVSVSLLLICSVLPLPAFTKN